MTLAQEAAVNGIMEDARATMPFEASDWPLAIALLSPLGHIIAQKDPSFLYCTVIESVVRARLASPAPPQWRIGTLHLSNDPYAGGLGLDVVVMLAPVIAGAGLAGFAGAALRVADIGAMRDDIFAFGRQIMHEGVRLAALDLSLDGIRLPETLRMFLEVNTRVPAVTVPALEAVAAVLRRVSASDLPHRAAEIRPPTFAPCRGGAIHRCGARLSLEITCVAGRIRVAVDPAEMDSGGLNGPLQATRAGILAGLGEASAVAPWQIGDLADIDVPVGSRFNPAYPSAVNLAAEGAWLAYRATLDALGRQPALSERDFASVPSKACRNASEPRRTL